jgi:hypothetical protein
VLVAVPIKGRTSLDAGDIDLPEGDWEPLWPDRLPVQVWVSHA